MTFLHNMNNMSWNKKNKRKHKKVSNELVLSTNNNNKIEEHFTQGMNPLYLKS